MTRRSSTPHLGALISVYCKDGHKLAEAVYDGTDLLLLSDEEGRWGGRPIPRITDPLLEFDGLDYEAFMAAPMRLICRPCVKAGRTPDLRGSWTKLREFAASFETVDKTRAARYVVGG